MHVLSRLGNVAALCVLLLGLFTGTCYANYGMMVSYPGWWTEVAVVAILLVETLAIGLICKVGWLAAFLAASAANVFSALGGSWGAPHIAVLATNIIFETPIVVLVLTVWIAHASQQNKPRRSFRRLVMAGIMMNLLTYPFVPILDAAVGREDMGNFRRTACLSNLKQIAAGVQMYQAEYGTLPQADSFTELRECMHTLLPRHFNPEIFTCPGGTIRDGEYLPLHPRRLKLPYTCTNFRKLPPAPERSKANNGLTPIIWDSAPVHRGGRNLAFLDGHVKWYVEPPAFPLWSEKSSPVSGEQTSRRPAAEESTSRAAQRGGP